MFDAESPTLAKLVLQLRSSLFIVGLESSVWSVGWALIVNSTFLTILIALWGALYIGVPFTEEPCLEQRYGPVACIRIWFES